VVSVEPPEPGEHRQDHGEAVRPVPVRDGREDRELRFLLRLRFTRDLGDDGRAQDQRLDASKAETEIDLLRSPGGHLRVRRDHEDDCGALFLCSHDDEVDGPGELLARILVALDFEDNREHQLAVLVAKLEDQIGAELNRDELIQGRFDHRDRGIRREVEMEEDFEEMRREVRVLAEHRHEAVVLQRRHGRHHTVLVQG
jgi:hypothetical protein